MPNRPEYQAWRDMNRRCYDSRTESFPNYGGRGISVCEEWRGSFKSFFKYIGIRPDGHSLERLDSDGNYEPGNVRWATRMDQNSNRCSVVRLEFNGKTMTMREWSGELGINYDCLRYRIQYAKWPLDRALSPESWISPARRSALKRGEDGLRRYWGKLDVNARSQRAKAAYENRGRV